MFREVPYFREDRGERQAVIITGDSHRSHRSAGIFSWLERGEFRLVSVSGLGEGTRLRPVGLDSKPHRSMH